MCRKTLRSFGNLGRKWDYCTSVGSRSYTRTPFDWVRTGTDMLVYRDNYVRKLGATFGRYIYHKQAKIASVVTYEKQDNTPSDTRCTVVLSKFSR